MSACSVLRWVGPVAAVAFVAGAEDATCSAAGGPGCRATPAPEHFCPFKGHDVNHSGWSHFTGPFDISKPLWVWEEPNRKLKGADPYMKVFHSSPMIDGDYNVYIQSTTGWVYSIDKAGKTRWEFQAAAGSPANMAIVGDAVYTIDEGGTAFAIDRNSGKELWRNKVVTGAPADTHSVVVHDDLVLTACNPKVHDMFGYPKPGNLMGEALCALDIKNGSLRWSFDMVEHTGRKDALSCNMLPAVVEDSVIIGDDFGGLYRLSLKDGSLRWYTHNITSVVAIHLTGGMTPYGTTATSMVGPNDMAYHAFNVVAKHGTVRAHDVHTGRLKWSREFAGTEVNAAVGVGKIYGRDKLAVIAALGPNPETAATFQQIAQKKFREVLLALGLRKLETQVLALDARNGNTLWKLDLAYDGYCAGSFVSHDGEGTFCAPDVWGQPTIGADGTVYLNWSGGKAFAVRDANGDGVVDPKDPAEVSSYYHGFGSNGATAIAPGFVVAPTCRQLIAFSS